MIHVVPQLVELVVPLKFGTFRISMMEQTDSKERKLVESLIRRVMDKAFPADDVSTITGVTFTPGPNSSHGDTC